MTTPSTRVVRRSRPPSPSVLRPWGHRPELDGLRVFAVYSVVLYHAGLSQFAGGFIGVDLFFVLSGFLVTNVLMSEHSKQGSISPLRFFARRFRRLLPAAAVTILLTTLVFAAISTPVAREALVGDARSAFLYFANWHFLASAGDYFAAESAASPFLHFWSLSIEEQFYFVFPLLLSGSVLLARRRGNRLNRPALLVFGAVFVASLVTQVELGNADAARAYWGTGARLYQMLAGVILALILDRWRQRETEGLPIPRWLSARAGSVLLVAGVVAFCVLVTDLPVSPSRRGLMATVVSVAMVLGLELRARGALPRFLGLVPMTYLGRISYGTYLWHWPLAVFITTMLDVTPVMLALLIVVGGTAAAALSHDLIETPVRRNKRLDASPRLVVATGLCISLLGGLVVTPLILNSDLPILIKPAGPTMNASAAESTGDPVREDLDFATISTKIASEPDCLNDRPAEDCIIRKGSGRHVLLLGDSHAQASLATWEMLADEHDLTLSAVITTGCPWQEGLLVDYTDGTNREGRCAARQPLIYDRILPELDPDVVVVANRTYDDPANPRDMADSSGNVSEDQESLIRSTTEDSVRKLTEVAEQLIIIEPLPIAPGEGDRHFDPTECLSAATTTGECMFTATKDSIPSERIYREIADSYPNAVSVDMDRLTCPRFPTCDPIVDDVVVRMDHNHLSYDFSRHISGSVRSLLSDLGVWQEISGQSSKEAQSGNADGDP